MFSAKMPDSSFGGVPVKCCDDSKFLRSRLDRFLSCLESILLHESPLHREAACTLGISVAFVVLFDKLHVRGWHIARKQYSSLYEGAVINSLDDIDIGEEVLVRVEVG